jgi:hypothetical protein
MSLAGELDYAQARLCARFGQRPDEVAWRSIEPIRGLPALLDAARRLPFHSWIEGLTATATPHEIEAALAVRRRALVAEVVCWMPEGWQPAVEWAGIAADLPVLEHLSRGGATLPWMRQDPFYKALCADGGRAPSGPPFLPLAPGWKRPDGLLCAWRQEWIRRLPRSAPGGALDELARTFASQRIDPRAVSALAAVRRNELSTRLVVLFRRAAGEAAAAFVFLAISALDLERLRGELLRRAVFPGFGLAA